MIKSKRFFCMFLSFIILISSMGGLCAAWIYATDPPDDLNEQVNINLTEFEYKAFEGVYIESISVYDYKNLTELATDFSFPTDIYSSVRARSGAYITYKVRLFNNSSVNYWYINRDYEDDLENNSLINAQYGVTITMKDSPSDLSPTFDSNDWIPANNYRDVYVTYHFDANATGDITTFVTYLFGVRMDAVYTDFEAVLNNADSYELLSRAFDEKYKETGSTILANVGDEKEIFDQIFGGNITVNIDGEQVPVTIMISRENIDGKATGDSYYGSGPSGCEYTLYITVDELDLDKNKTGKATVYAVTYSEGGISNQDQWYQLGELYEGTTNLDSYFGNDAFDIYSWEASPKEYIVADGITYKIGLEQGDQYQKMKKLEELMAVKDSEIFNKINNTQIFKKAYNIIYTAGNEGKPGYDLVKQAFLNAAPFYTINNNGGDIPVNTNCTRAEILPYIEALQSALDYYYQVN